jgi:ferredoxin-NADP reductase
VARAALSGRLTWQLAKVSELIEETPRCKSLVLDASAWQGHRAGQHVDVRLTAEDGYQAQRSYSIASSPEDPNLVLTVERLEDGEVSPYLVDELRAGDDVELRGPIGGYFVWEEEMGGPLMLIAGGSGIVPLRAMARHWATVGSDARVRLLYSARSLEEVIYRNEWLGARAYNGLAVQLALTRDWPEGWDGHRGRITPELLRQSSWPPEDHPRTYICGPTGFVEAITEALVRAGHEATRIRTERFGPTGG